MKRTFWAALTLCCLSAVAHSAEPNLYDLKCDFGKGKTKSYCHAEVVLCYAGESLAQTATAEGCLDYKITCKDGLDLAGIPAVANQGINDLFISSNPGELVAHIEVENAIALAPSRLLSGHFSGELFFLNNAGTSAKTYKGACSILPR